ncbi:anthranilate synthase component I family protein [uncultured Maribacter sp.]|uniref:anthranilate synthase component I family protein n=1 Tax=uncultured Maribacter sp. TaxID=431308 RepID=UPI002616B918|nr:anthranilate synthase component I family protein [uncultured Maribacter sp.]
MRKTIAYSIANITQFKKAALQWSQQFDEVTWLDSNNHTSKYSSFDALLAVDGLTAFVTDTKNAFHDFKEYQKTTKDWLFGYLSYDLKNDVERLSSSNLDNLHFPELYFYQPKKIIKIIGYTVEFIYLNMVDDEIEEDFDTISSLALVEDEKKSKDIKIKMRIFKDEYFRKVKKMLAYIQRGDIYEANFCQEFYAENTEINPLKVFNKLNNISEAPFATFLKVQDKYVLSASPERYLKKVRNTLISQPIKGTAKRSKDTEEDEELKKYLSQDEKERAENIMIVDLVRNDLSKSATKGSVRVEELCKVYSFEQVHQMISTITAEIPLDKNVVDVLKETFPMGSMTGAPKVSAMEIIEELESFKRGVYSGAVGYITPEQDFDFNVIIRSILYNATEKYVSYAVGGAITAKAIPEREYEECLLKAKAMRQVLESK